MSINSASTLDSMINIIIERSLHSLNSELEVLRNRLEEVESQTHSKRMFQQKELIKEFGIGHATLKKWVALGLPEVWIENRVYYDREDVTKFLLQHKM